MRTNLTMHKQNKGFTMVELLVVIALIGLITLLTLPTVSSFFQVSLGSATRDLATTIKEAYNSAVITGKVHRIAYDLKSHEFWAESGPTNTLLSTESSKEKERKKKRSNQNDNVDSGQGASFSLDKAITKKKKPLPRGVEFESILSESDRDPVREGMAYTHIFPNGITERTLIYLKDSRKHQLTLAIEPITGKTRMLQGHLSNKEVFGDAK